MIGTTLKKRFFLERELGRGGMGVVYRAIDQVLDRPVAIKVLKEVSGEEVGRKLRLEAQILARLMHENIVRLYDFDEEEAMFYFIMEEVDGPSYFHRWKQLQIPERLTILAQVADALDYAHHQGVVHRDLKPGNILLTSKDQAKLSDFGLSLLVGQDQETGVARGTPQYMSPEQAKGLKLDHRTDLYSLGILIYESATGTVPFSGNPMGVMSQHVTVAPEPPRARNAEVSEPLEQLILNLLAKAPEKRPSAGREIADSLREMVRTEAWLNQGKPPAAGTIVAARPAKAAMPVGLAEEMLAEVTSEPIQITPEERFLAGHYLAYLLGGSRRKGILMRRPLDPLNSDRARLMLAMTWLSLGEPTDERVARAAKLLEEKPDVRTKLDPSVVTRYLRSRDTPAKRKRFRTLRQKLQEASPYAQTKLTDERGILNPGLMPQTLGDLEKVAPANTSVDDHLVERWNRLTDLWRQTPEFRKAVLSYATTHAADDPASVDLWPEVVYPLIERARWQRRHRTGTEAFWDVITGRVAPTAASGVRLDREIERVVPASDVDDLDVELEAFDDQPDLADDVMDGGENTTESYRPSMKVSAASLRELTSETEATKREVRLSEPDPIRLTFGELRDRWKLAAAALRSGGVGTGSESMPVGPYRLTVVASIRGRKAGTLVIQGMGNKQIEMIVPPFTGGTRATTPIVAIWNYQNRSLAICYLEVRGDSKYVIWDAATGVRFDSDDAANFHHELLQRGLEVPDQADRVLTSKFRPRSTA